MSEKLIRCSCGSLYQIHLYTTADQSKCPECRLAERREYEEQQRRKGAKS